MSTLWGSLQNSGVTKGGENLLPGAVGEGAQMSVIKNNDHKFRSDKVG